MCRSIRVLRTAEGPHSSEEVHAAALQYVQKVSGYREPSERNRRAFEAAVDTVAVATEQLLTDLPPRRSRKPASSCERGHRR